MSTLSGDQPESHNHMPLGAGLVLLGVAAYQIVRNSDLHSNLVLAAAEHNLIDGLLPLLALATGWLSLKLSRRHWSKNLDPGGAIAVYGIMMAAVGATVLGQEPRAGFNADLVQVESVDFAANLIAVAWIMRRSRSNTSRAMVFHLSIDMLIAPAVIMGAWLAQAFHFPVISQVTAGVIIAVVAGVVAKEVFELREELHLHRETNCLPDPDV